MFYASKYYNKASVAFSAMNYFVLMYSIKKNNKNTYSIYKFSFKKVCN